MCCWWSRNKPVTHMEEFVYRCSPLITQEHDSTKVRKHSLHRSLKSIKLQVRLGCANACPVVKSVLNPAMVLWRVKVMQCSTNTQPFYGPFSKWASARRRFLLLHFMVQEEITWGRHTDSLAGCHSIRTNQWPTFINPLFLCWMPFLPQAAQFILSWDRRQICLLAYPMAWFHAV